ncbi:MAG: UDP-2,3-diacylglucosamine diphosphatase [Proteobacteria bacterium]|nr:UDP-2,3-diacylglucosamine diphosphatase [Pseudomonadota bacterium]HQR03670.1 UDP-2,3-diacylglucosamine diphosphatase [Rhodocyclaceae bacterium]
MELFVSDIHLCPSRPAVTELFLAFLAGPASRAGTLHILGDLFEYWLGDDDLDDPFNARICAALKAVAEGGTTLAFIAGNRDFLAGDAFARATGLRSLDDPCEALVAGHRTLLLHGDLLCTDDHEYQDFRRRVRSPTWREQFLAQPLARRREQVEVLRQRSEQEKQTKAGALMDASPAATVAAFRDHGVRRMIHGHTHRLAHHTHEVDGQACQRWVLGDWHESGGSFLECGADSWALRPWAGC